MHDMHSARLPGQSCWQAVMAAGGSACARCRGGAVHRPAGTGRHVPGQVRRAGGGHPGGGDERRACQGSAHGGHRVGWLYGTGTWPCRSPGCWTRCLARPARRALTGMPATWPAVGGVSPAPSRAPQAGSGASARGSGARSIAGSPHAAGVMLMPGSRQPDDGAGKYPEMPLCEK